MRQWGQHNRPDVKRGDVYIAKMLSNARAGGPLVGDYELVGNAQTDQEFIKLLKDYGIFSNK